MENIPTPEERLERGELLSFPHCPFALPPDDDLAFLRTQRLGLFSHKNISYDPTTGRVGGYQNQGAGPTERLRAVLTAFSAAVTGWLDAAYPRYAAGRRPDRASFRPAEEATRRLRHTA